MPYTFNVQLPDRVISRAWSWEDYRRVGPLSLSLDHCGPEGGCRINK